MPKYWGERIMALVFIGLSIYFIVPAIDFPALGGAFPIFSFGAIIFCSLIILLSSFFKKNPSMKAKMKFKLDRAAVRPLVLTGLVFLHIWLMNVIGYFSSALLFLISASLFLGIRNYRSLIVTIVILFPALYAFFIIFLQAELPSGILI